LTKTCPFVEKILLFNKPSADRAVNDFPEPDSPTIPSDWAFSSLKDMSLISGVFELLSDTL